LLLRSGADIEPCLLDATLTHGANFQRVPPLLGAQASISEAASLILLAAGPWSVESHSLFPDKDRARMKVLVHSLYHVYMRNIRNGGWQAVDFARLVMSFVLER